MKALLWVFALCFLASAAELAYVGSTPPVGTGDLAPLMMDYGKVAPIEPYGDGYISQKAVEQANSVYSGFYLNRPHAADVSVNYYRMYLLGAGINDVMIEGILLWRLGIFRGLYDYPDMIEESSSDGYLFSFSEIPGSAAQQRALLRYLHAQDAGVPETAEGMEYVVSGRNLTVKKGGETVLHVWADSDGNCWYKRPVDAEDRLFGQVMKKGGDAFVYVDVYPKLVSAYGPRAVSSAIYPEKVSVICCYQGSAGKEFPEGPLYPGRQFSLMPLGWIILSEYVPANSYILFDDGFSNHLNVTHEEFLTAYAEEYRNIFARLTFIESVLDGRPPSSGIYYLAYYPRYGKIWVVVKGIPEEDLAAAKTYIDDKEASFSVLSPFIFVDASPSEGNHVMKIVLPSKTYASSFYVDESPLSLPNIYTVFKKEGNLSLSLVSISQNRNETILVKDAEISWTLEDAEFEFISGSLAANRKVIASRSGQERAVIDKKLDQYGTVTLNVKIPGESKLGEDFDADVAIIYVQDGQEKQYLARIATKAE